MYKLVYVVSAIIRQFVLSNPYKSLINDELYADLFNIFIGGTILHYCAYFLTGTWYVKGVGEEIKGSVGYLLNYCYLTILITVLGYISYNVKLFIILFIIIYLLSCFFEHILFKKNIM